MYSLASGTICCGLLGGIGRAAGCLQKSYDAIHEVAVEADWRWHLVSATHLTWTLPLGIVVAVCLVMKDRSSLRARAWIINTLVLLGTFSFTLFWALAAFPLVLPWVEVISAPG